MVQPEGERPPAPSGEDPWVDRALLEGVKRREAAALESFFDLAFPFVHGLAYRLTGHRQTAEDLTQEVFLKVYRAADRIETHRSPRPWLTVITGNAVRDSLRRREARPERLDDPATLGARAAAQDEDPDRQADAASLVERALKALDPLDRSIVVLHDYEGLPHTEIAPIVGVSHSAVRKRYSRALKRMKSFLEGVES